MEKFLRVNAIEGVRYIARQMITSRCAVLNLQTGYLNDGSEQPAKDMVADTYLFLEGEIYNRGDLRAHLAGGDELPVCRLLLALYQKYGQDFVQYLNGEFNIVIYEKKKHRLLIINDHIASKPIYYLEQPGKLIFGSEKKSIVAISSGSNEIDKLGMLQFFAFTHNLNSATFIKNLHFLPPASILAYQSGKTHIMRYRATGISKFKHKTDVRSLIEEYCEKLKQAMELRLQGKDSILLNLSGGLDSRALALAIPRDFRPINTRTKGLQDSLEVKYAVKIAQRLQFNHYIEATDAVPFSWALPKVVWRTECTVNFFNCLSIANHAVMRKKGKFLITGVYGNTSTGDAIRPQMLIPVSWQQFMANMYKKITTRFRLTANQIFRKSFLERYASDLRDSFNDSFEDIDAESNVERYEHWVAYVKQPRTTLGPAPVDTYLFEHVRPFLDRDYLDFVLSLPIKLRFGQTLYQAAIHKLGPEIRDIPYANTNLKIRDSITGNRLNLLLSLSQQSFNRACRRLGWSPVNPYIKAGEEDFAALIRGDKNFKNYLEGFIVSDACDPDIFNNSGIRDIIDQHYGGYRDYTDTLCLMATMFKGIEYFVSNKSIACPTEAQPLS